MSQKVFAVYIMANALELVRQANPFFKDLTEEGIGEIPVKPE